MNRSIFVLGLLILFMLNTTMAQDPLKVGSNIYKLVLENDQARLLEITFKPGDSIGIHSHPDHFVYIMSGGKLKISVVGGETQVLDLKKGQGVFIPAQSHSAVNVGDTEINGLVVEIKKNGITPNPKK